METKSDVFVISRERDIKRGDYECLETLNEIMNSFDKVGGFTNILNMATASTYL